MHKSTKRGSLSYRFYLQLMQINSWGSTRKLTMLLVKGLGKKPFHWHNQIYCSSFKLFSRESLCIQTSGKLWLTWHLPTVISAMSVLVTVFTQSSSSGHPVSSHHFTPQHWSACLPAQRCTRKPGVWIVIIKQGSQPGLNWLDSCFFWPKGLKKIANYFYKREKMRDMSFSKYVKRFFPWE